MLMAFASQRSYLALFVQLFSHDETVPCPDAVLIVQAREGSADLILCYLQRVGFPSAALPLPIAASGDSDITATLFGLGLRRRRLVFQCYQRPCFYFG